MVLHDLDDLGYPGYRKTPCDHNPFPLVEKFKRNLGGWPPRLPASSVGPGETALRCPAEPALALGTRRLASFLDAAVGLLVNVGSYLQILTEE